MGLLVICFDQQNVVKVMWDFWISVLGDSVVSAAVFFGPCESQDEVQDKRQMQRGSAVSHPSYSDATPTIRAWGHVGTVRPSPTYQDTRSPLLSSISCGRRDPDPGFFFPCTTNIHLKWLWTLPSAKIQVKGAWYSTVPLKLVHGHTWRAEESNHKSRWERT